VIKPIARAVIRRLPFRLAVALSRGYPDVAFYINGGRRQLRIDDYLDQWNVNIDTFSDIERRMLSRTYESETMGVIDEFVSAGDICVDVGANVGAIALALAKRTGESGKVHAFEPGPPLFERLQDNVRLNPGLSSYLELHQMGLSDKQDELCWQESSRDHGNATIRWADNNRPVTRIPVTTLDDFAREHSLERLDFLKIDVEGMEYEVLSGGKVALAKFMPVIYFETSLCDEEQKAAARGSEIFLENLGYRLHKVLNCRGDIRPTNFPDLGPNTVAVHRSRRI